MQTLAKGTSGSLNNVLMQLRKVCNHPFLMNDKKREDMYNGGDISMVDELVSTCGKLELLDKLLARLKVAPRRTRGQRASRVVLLLTAHARGGGGGGCGAAERRAPGAHLFPVHVDARRH